MLKLKIYDVHYNQTFEDGEFRFTPVTPDLDWLKFDYYFDPELMKIDSFREYILFDSENLPMRCTKVYFTDGTIHYVCLSVGKFLDFYNNEYLKNINETNAE